MARATSEARTVSEVAAPMAASAEAARPMPCWISAGTRVSSRLAGWSGPGMAATARFRVCLERVQGDEPGASRGEGGQPQGIRRHRVEVVDAVAVPVAGHLGHGRPLPVDAGLQ